MSTHPTDTPEFEPESLELIQDLADESPTDAAPEDEQIVQLYSYIGRLTAERDQAQEQMKRAMADFQNLRKRTQAEAAGLRQAALERFVTALLPVLDNFERTATVAQSGASLESVLEGVRAVERQLRGVLESNGVTRVESVGKAFDPELHEAVGMQETDEVEEGAVASEVEPGYRLGEKVVRPARVRVAKRS